MKSFRSIGLESTGLLFILTLDMFLEAKSEEILGGIYGGTYAGSEIFSSFVFEKENQEEDLLVAAELLE